MVGKKIGIIIALILVAGIYTYYIVATRIIDPFIIDASKATVEKAAPNLLNTTQDYNFRLTNISDKPIKLIDIQLSGYSGIRVGELKCKGVTPNGLEIPSHRVYNLSGWSTNSQGLMIDYAVTIEEPNIVNPKKATITYSYMGIKHKQVLHILGM